MYWEAENLEELLETLKQESKTRTQRSSEIPLLFHLTILVSNYFEIIKNLMELYEKPEDDIFFIEYVSNCGYPFTYKKIIEHQSCTKKLKKQISVLCDLNKGLEIMSKIDDSNHFLLKETILKALPHFKNALVYSKKLWLAEIDFLNVKHLVINMNDGFINDIIKHNPNPKDQKKLKETIISEFSRPLALIES